jgi:hypothetical protein
MRSLARERGAAPDAPSAQRRPASRPAASGARLAAVENVDGVEASRTPEPVLRVQPARPVRRPPPQHAEKADSLAVVPASDAGAFAPAMSPPGEERRAPVPRRAGARTAALADELSLAAAGALSAAWRTRPSAGSGPRAGAAAEVRVEIDRIDIHMEPPDVSVAPEPGPELTLDAYLERRRRS